MQVFNLMTQQNFGIGFSLNTNFLETNVFNIILLLLGLIYVLKQFLGSMLSVRQEKVLFAIRESEERLSQANIRLNEAEKQLTQTQIIIDQIIKDAEMTAQRVRQSILEQGESDIERLTISSKASIQNAENQVRQQIQQKVTALAINKVALQIESQMTPAMQIRIIDNNIVQLKGDITI